MRVVLDSYKYFGHMMNFDAFCINRAHVHGINVFSIHNYHCDKLICMMNDTHGCYKYVYKDVVQVERL